MINSLPHSLIESAKKVLEESNTPKLKNIADVKTNFPDTHIDVDGELKHRYNSEGNLIHHTDEGIKKFHKWFKNSTFTDHKGRPLVMYHGVKPRITMKMDSKGNLQKTLDGEFDVDYHTFDVHQFHPSSNGKLGSGVFITSDRKEAENYTEGKGAVYPLYANGAPIRKETKLGITNWTVHPHQLKSAIGNDGTFDHPFRIHEDCEITTSDHYSLLEWKLAARKLGAYVYQSGNMNEGVDNLDIWYASHKDNKNINGQFFKGKGLQCGHISYPTKEDLSSEIIESFCEANSTFQSNNSFFYCDFLLNESLDTKYKLHDVTELALKQKPTIQQQNDNYGITHYKVEFHPETNQIFTTFHRDGAWEIHHQKDDKVGESVRSKSPPLGFSAHVLNFIKEKMEKNEKVRVHSTKDMIHTFHKKAKNISEKIGADVTPIEKGIDPHQTGLDIHEFLIYPKSLKESLLPLQFINPHDRMRFLYEYFGDIPAVKEYKEKLIKQGHKSP